MSEAEESEVLDDLEPEDSVDNELIEKATRQGWKPKEEWEGDPERWTDAETFIKRGEEILPIVRANNKKLEEELSQLKQAREEDKKVFEEFKEFQEEARKRAEREYKQELEAIKARKADAVETGDKAAFTQAEADEDRLREERQQRKPPEQPDQPKEHPDFQPWLKDNSWYNDSRVARALANDIALELGQSTTLQGKDFFDAVAKQVKLEMPDLFENPNRKKAPAVEGAGGGKPRPKGKTYSDLPPEAKKACDDFVRKGFLTKEQYVADYDWSQA